MCICVASRKGKRAGRPPGWRAARAAVVRRQPAQPWTLLLQVGCTANEPVDRLILCRFIQAHLSAFSSPRASIQPLPAPGSVTASRYSWPATMLNPSSLPPRMFWPQPLPASRTYGMFVYGRPPVMSWYAQKPAFGKPSGWVLCGLTTMMFVLVLFGALKWARPLRASAAICPADIFLGALAALSTQVPLSTVLLPNVGCLPCPVYCEVTVDQWSWLRPSPWKYFVR